MPLFTTYPDSLLIAYGSKSAYKIWSCAYPSPFDEGVFIPVAQSRTHSSVQFVRTQSHVTLGGLFSFVTPRKRQRRCLVRLQAVNPPRGPPFHLEHGDAWVPLWWDMVSLLRIRAISRLASVLSHDISIMVPFFFFKYPPFPSR